MSISRAITGISKADSTLTHLSQPALTLSVPQDVPTASSNASSFINKINVTDLRYTFFDDDLATFTDLESEMGFYKASVKEGCFKGDNCIIVDARSEGKVDGVLCFTHVTAYLNQTLQTLHQELHEVVQLPQDSLDRYTTIDLKTEGYQVHKVVKQGAKKDVLERTFELSLMDGYISEGANIVLQRILVTKGLPDYFDVLSFDSDTNLCLASYTDLVSNKIFVGSGAEKTSVDCYGMERRLQCLTDVPVTWHTYFLSDGHLVSRAQVGSPMLMKIRSVPQLMERDEFLPAPVFPKVPLNWRDDPQLSSMYQERKEALASANRLYVRSHRELQSLMADFLQSLLAHKPEDTLQFARNFFSSFSNRFVVMEPTHLHSQRPGTLLSDKP